MNPIPLKDALNIAEDLSDHNARLDIKAEHAIRSLVAQVEALTAENAQIRELMNLYNLGGWTDSLTLMQERDSLINLLENSWQGWFPAVHDGAGYDRHEFVFKSSERDLRAAIAKETA